jgi:DNA polymerase III subunit gamma/tau
MASPRVAPAVVTMKQQNQQQLSLSTRPKSFEEMVGQQKITAAIRGHMKSGRVVKAWLFSGPKGTGKTSISRIMSLAYQCTHQQTFGAPCKECYNRKASFAIEEINTADISTVDKLRDVLQGSFYGVMGSGKYRVYILDECHRLSDAAQQLLLKYLEDSPETTIFILCSTAPQRLLETVRSRCVTYEMRELDQDDILLLVTKYLKKAKSDLPADRLADALSDQYVKSPRLIAQAVEKYCAGLSPDDAAQVNGATEVDVHTLCRAVIKGDWPDVAKYLHAAQEVNVRAIRVGVVAYLRVILLESPEMEARTETVAKAITVLCNVQYAEDIIQSASLAAELYKCCKLFAAYQR